MAIDFPFRFYYSYGILFCHRYQYKKNSHQRSILMLRNIQMALHFLDKDMMRKNITTMKRPKLEYAKVVWYKKKVSFYCLTISPTGNFHRTKIVKLEKFYVKL